MKLLSNNFRYYEKQNNNLEHNKLTVKQSITDINQNKIKTHRPTQEISFSGSAVSLASNATKKFIPRLIDFVYDNETAYTAVYSLIVAGMLKPLCVLNMPGSEDKDKQIVATKNFLQAFIGSFTGYTVGGMLVKQAIDIVKNNLKLIKQNSTKTGFEIIDINKNRAKIDKIAKSILEKEKSSFISKYNTLQKEQGLTEPSFKNFINAFFKKAVVAEKKPATLKKNEIFIPITKAQIKDKGISIVLTAKKHLKIYNAKGATNFVNTLLENGKEQELSKTASSISKLFTSDKEKFKTEVDSLVDLVKGSAQAGSKSFKKSELTDAFGRSAAAALQSEEKTIRLNCKKAIGSLSENLKNTLATVTSKDSANELLQNFIKDSKKYFADETMQDTFESFWKNSTGWITSIAKAKISSLLLPGVMTFLFAKKNLEKELAKKEKRNKIQTLNLSKNFAQESEKFQKITKKQDKVSFKGKLIDGTAYGVQKLATTKFGQKVITTLHNFHRPFNKTSARASDLESFMITGYWTVNTWTSKKIAPDQKLGLILHSLLVTGVSSVLAFTIDTLLDPLLVKFVGNYKKNITNIAKEALKSNDIATAVEENAKNIVGSKRVIGSFKEILQNSKPENFFTSEGKLISNTALFKEIDSLSSEYGKKLRKFKSLSIFTLIVRFLVPVLMVPVSGKLKRKVKELQNVKKDNKLEANKSPKKMTK